MVEECPWWLARLSTSTVKCPAFVGIRSTFEVCLIGGNTLRIHAVTEGGAQGAEEGPAPTALWREGSLMWGIGVVIGWMGKSVWEWLGGRER